MKINDYVKVIYLGEDNPLTLRTGKVYIARSLKMGWYGIVDETARNMHIRLRFSQFLQMTNGKHTRRKFRRVLLVYMASEHGATPV